MVIQYGVFLKPMETSTCNSAMQTHRATSRRFQGAYYFEAKF